MYTENNHLYGRMNLLMSEGAHKNHGEARWWELPTDYCLAMNDNMSSMHSKVMTKKSFYLEGYRSQLSTFWHGKFTNVWRGPWESRNSPLMGIIN